MTFVFIIALIHFSFFNIFTYTRATQNYQKRERLLLFAEVKTRNSNAMFIPINILYVLRH